MNLTLMLYLAHFGDKIDILCGIALLLCGLVSFFTIVVSSHDDLAESFKSSLRYYIPKIVLTSALLLLLLPNSKTIYMMIAVGLSEQVFDSPLAQKTLMLLDNKLDNYLKEEAKK